jgi:hypothetical protein
MEGSHSFFFNPFGMVHFSAASTCEAMLFWYFIPAVDACPITILLRLLIYDMTTASATAPLAVVLTVV